MTGVVTTLYCFAAFSLLIAQLIENRGNRPWAWWTSVLCSSIATGIVVKWNETGVLLGFVVSSVAVVVVEAVLPRAWRRFRHRRQLAKSRASGAVVELASRR